MWFAIPFGRLVWICVMLSMACCHCSHANKEAGNSFNQQTSAPSTSIQVSDRPLLISQVSNQPSDSQTGNMPSESHVIDSATLTMGGWLEVDIAQNVVLDKLGKPDVKSEISRSQFTGMFEQNWSFRTQGISLTMTAKTLEMPLRVRLITISSPCNLRTPEGIGIGSLYSDVESVYASKINADYSDKKLMKYSEESRIVLGDIYWGTLFYFKNSKVNEIYIGATIE